ncbi:molybdate ABC transporter ATP-binding protein [Haemophilus pittmaniae]|uniref:Molybdate ABC transporter ATP-binding protein n=1 Tax=Haemophilus pittmaniae TaxID=249188 RepID=A0A377IZP0_9PAST|nr:molybdate ABC transporter ATP-binding protein ModF [Haemophilus pittmaniae]STO93569.1 molybdate ABC transporter ATP-binding protein [Haemophilus pittmaniae]
MTAEKATLIIKDAFFALSQHRQLSLPQFTLEKGQYWAVVGGNGSGKSAFAQALCGELELSEGCYQNGFACVRSFSFEKQRARLEETLKALRNDDVAPEFFGQTALEVILGEQGDLVRAQEVAQQLAIEPLLDRFFIKLSTGESRKVLLARALMDKPDLLVLDEPFEGLDQASVAAWTELLGRLTEQCAIVLIVNRLADIPPQADHLALLDKLMLILADERAAIEAQSLYHQLVYAENAANVELPTPAAPLEGAPFSPYFVLRDVTVSYSSKAILSHLNWTVEAGQHWWIKGPNGAGKSTLLSLINGDNPQAFSNQVEIFGRQRGSGETVWEIKQKIGCVGSQLHMDYRVNCSALDVVLSGFFDSIGVYCKVPDALRLKAMQWLQRVHLGDLAKAPFRSLSWGQQRLLLILRAMVKHPPVLILDEPFQGLDGLNRKLVRQFVDQLAMNSQTQLLFVSHRDEDIPDCITHVFEFIKENEGYRYIQQAR